MLYLLDANVLIEAKNTYYEFGRVDQYWEWLVFQAEQGNVKIPREIYEETVPNNKKGKKDKLAEWARANKTVLLLQEEVDIALVQRVMVQGYAPDLTDIELQIVGRDPFLIAYGLADRENRMVVTGEVRSNRQRQNRPIPSVCETLGVKSCNQWEFGRVLNFRTDWKRS